jgi:hypothetical protein
MFVDIPEHTEGIPAFTITGLGLMVMLRTEGAAALHPVPAV